MQAEIHWPFEALQDTYQPLSISVFILNLFQSYWRSGFWHVALYRIELQGVHSQKLYWVAQDFPSTCSHVCVQIHSYPVGHAVTFWIHSFEKIVALHVRIWNVTTMRKRNAVMNIIAADWLCCPNLFWMLLGAEKNMLLVWGKAELASPASA